MVTIPNGVDVDGIKFVERQRGKNLACVGYINMRKNSMFLLQCMHRLHYHDPGYKLFFAGIFQDAMLEQYLKHMIKKLGLCDSVFFDGWQSDIFGWLEDKHYVVSASIAESQGMGIMEGIAAGLKPVIHNFAGASEIYPQEFLFNTIEQFCEEIQWGSYEPERYRRFIEQNYPQKQQSKRVNEVIVKLERQIETNIFQSDDMARGEIMLPLEQVESGK
jgi:glycosyltransferase involved in cell wall biosynthesis